MPSGLPNSGKKGDSGAIVLRLCCQNAGGARFPTEDVKQWAFNALELMLERATAQGSRLHTSPAGPLAQLNAILRINPSRGEV